MSTQDNPSPYKPDPQDPASPSHDPQAKPPSRPRPARSPRRPRGYINSQRPHSPAASVLAGGKADSPAVLRQMLCLAASCSDVPPVLREFLLRTSADLFIHTEILQDEIEDVGAATEQLTQLITRVVDAYARGEDLPEDPDLLLPPECPWYPYCSSYDHVTAAEAALDFKGLARLYIEVLASIACPELEHPAEPLGQREVFSLLRAPPHLRVMAILATWNRAKEEGRI